jgi:hypothetical protein
MKCRRCRGKFEESLAACPHCGLANPAMPEVLRTSTVFISASGTDRVFRSFEEVPAGMRSRLLKSTSGVNATTFFIADRRGRREIAKALRRFPMPLWGSWDGTLTPGQPAAIAGSWLTPTRRRAVLATLALLASGVVALAFFRPF